MPAHVRLGQHNHVSLGLGPETSAPYRFSRLTGRAAHSNELRPDHMGFLIRALDGDPSAVTQPALPPLPTNVDEALVWASIEFLRRTSLPIEPRKKWPDGGMPQYGVKGFIAPGHQAQPGKALCVWGDAGWGGLVRRGKYHDSKFADDLLGACVKMVREWNPQLKPTWVVEHVMRLFALSREEPC